jgi:hypothetical protein
MLDPRCLAKKRSKKSTSSAPVDVAALEARMSELGKVGLEDEQDPAVLRAYMEEMLRGHEARA